MDIAGTLLKCMPEISSPIIMQKILPVYMPALMNLDVKDESKEADILDAMCLLCDCLEFGSQAMFDAISPQACPKMIEIIKLYGAKKFDFVQTAVFALGCVVLRTQGNS